MSGVELLMAASAAASLASGGVAAAGTIAQGNAGLAAARAEQRQLARMASEELAVATRGAADKRREAGLLQSRGQAVAAASGGRATDESVLEIIGGIARDANVQQRDILRTGQVKADDLMFRGRVGVNAARQNQRLSKWMAGGQIVSAAGDAFSKYGQGLEMRPASASSKPWWG